MLAPLTRFQTLPTEVCVSKCHIVFIVRFLMLPPIRLSYRTVLFVLRPDHPSAGSGSRRDKHRLTDMGSRVPGKTAFPHLSGARR